MKNCFTSTLIAGFFSLFPLFLHAQIQNVQVSVDGEQIIITYDYAAQSESIDDIVVSYTTGDETQIKEAKQVTGDLYGITPGIDKRIVWSPLREMATFSAENLVIHLTGIRDPEKQAECENNLQLADRFFFTDKDPTNAIIYYNEIINCLTCNCNPKDIAHATKQINLSQRMIKTSGAQDRFHVSYLFDMATAEGGNNMHGMSAYLLRNSGVGYYASFRSDKNFYATHENISDFEDDGDRHIDPTMNQPMTFRQSSWLFSTGVTYKVVHYDFVSGHLYGGVGLGANSLSQKMHVSERGFNEEVWATNGVKNLFFSPEVGIMANIYDYFTLMAGIKYPFSLTKNDAFKTKGLSAMVGAGIKLKSIEKNSYTRANTYVAYTIDIPDKTGPDKIQSINIIGFSVGSVSYHKPGAYFSARINPLIFNAKEEAEITENAQYTGVYDSANAFGTIGLTWMYFYGGLGVSYQKEYKIYQDEGMEVWNSPKSKLGLCTEFGVNLRLFDRLLLRGGVTFPNFRVSSKDSEFTMQSNKMFLSLGIGYVLPLN